MKVFDSSKGNKRRKKTQRKLLVKKQLGKRWSKCFFKKRMGMKPHPLKSS
jgi:hypothetical protein